MSILGIHYELKYFYFHAWFMDGCVSFVLASHEKIWTCVIYFQICFSKGSEFERLAL
jgi:hypothetical protein